MLMLLWACTSLTLTSPPLRDFPIVQPCKRRKGVNASLTGMYISPTDIADISPEEAPRALIDYIILSDKEGNLLYNDLFAKKDMIKEHRFCTFSEENISITPINGSIGGLIIGTPGIKGIPPPAPGIGAPPPIPPGTIPA